MAVLFFVLATLVCTAHCKPSGDDGAVLKKSSEASASASDHESKLSPPWIREMEGYEEDINKVMEAVWPFLNMLFGPSKELNENKRKFLQWMVEHESIEVDDFLDLSRNDPNKHIYEISDESYNDERIIPWTQEDVESSKDIENANGDYNNFNDFFRKNVDGNSKDTDEDYMFSHWIPNDDGYLNNDYFGHSNEDYFHDQSRNIFDDENTRISKDSELESEIPKDNVLPMNIDNSKRVFVLVILNPNVTLLTASENSKYFPVPITTEDSEDTSITTENTKDLSTTTDSFGDQIFVSTTEYFSEVTSTSTYSSEDDNNLSSTLDIAFTTTEENSLTAITTEDSEFVTEA